MTEGSGFDAVLEPVEAEIAALEAQLAAWRPADEAAEAIGAFLGDPGAEVPGITRTAGVCGGEPRVGNTRITVRTIETYRRSGVSANEMLQVFPGLTPEQVRAAFAHADANRPEIDRLIELNERA